MVLKEYEVCKYASGCPYNSESNQNYCLGSDSKRDTIFTCNLVSDVGVFAEGKFRSKYDETGQMKIIMENQ